MLSAFFMLFFVNYRKINMRKFNRNAVNHNLIFL